MDKRQQQLLAWIQHSTSFDVDSLRLISGDASFRRYFRNAASDLGVVFVDAPPQSENIQGFLSLTGVFEQLGIPVPQIHASDPSQGFFCVQDFGDTSLQAALTKTNQAELYHQAMHYLPKMHRISTLPDITLPQFDHALLKRDQGLFNHWFLRVHLSLELNAAQQKVLDDCFSQLTAIFAEQPQVGSHRDYHSRNLMLLASGELGVIDFQDALIAPATYDLASLLRDSYQVLPDDLVYALLESHRREYYPDIPEQRFVRWFDFTGLQRQLKICGIFARLSHRDNKHQYLKDISLTLDYIYKTSKKYSDLHAFQRVLQDHIMPALRSQDDT